MSQGGSIIFPMSGEFYFLGFLMAAWAATDIAELYYS